MTAPPDAAAVTFQAGFEHRWGALRQPRVRALAWLLSAPGLLDASDPYWDGKVMQQGGVTPDVERWLHALDRDPAPLEAAMGPRIYTRLGLYAEKLMAFYFQEQGRLVAHGLQVRATRNDTVGEFDFLLDAGPDGVEHIEFATKFYLLQRQDPDDLDALVGPNASWCWASTRRRRRCWIGPSCGRRPWSRAGCSIRRACRPRVSPRCAASTRTTAVVSGAGSTRWMGCRTPAM
jgi:hypothetical protein